MHLEIYISRERLIPTWFVRLSVGVVRVSVGVGVGRECGWWKCGIEGVKVGGWGWMRSWGG